MKREKLPKPVLQVIEDLEKKYGKGIAATNARNGNFYLYYNTSKTDKGTGRKTRFAKYLGKVSAEGRFEHPRHLDATAVINLDTRMNKEVKETLEKLRKEYTSVGVVFMNNRFNAYNMGLINRPEYIGWIDDDGTFYEHEKTNEDIKVEAEGLDKADVAILKCLSMNSRLPISGIANIAGIDVDEARRRKTALEKKFGIRYFPYVDVYKLGYSEYLCFVKFSSTVPNTEDLRKAFSAEPLVQMVGVAKGRYDLLVYMLAKDSFELNNILYRLRNTAVLISYQSEWSAVALRSTYGYIPMRDIFFDMIEKEKVWYKEKEALSKPKEMMTPTEYITLRELNTNGGSKFSEIAERYNLNAQNVRYAYYALKEKYKFITRMTMTMQNLPMRYNEIFLMKITDMNLFQQTRKNLLLNMTEEKYPTNKYCVIGNIFTPSGGFFVLPIYSGVDADALKNNFISNIQGIELEEGIITEVIVGKICYRLYDNVNSTQYKELVEEYKVKEYENKIIYDKEFPIEEKYLINMEDEETD